ncbi:MAG TPA: non-heme iron oxygenase ferredoxin subunit [Longimicrobiales bacterium]|nr:non-heme iron oxygenase ferredoxin subunit [Longimicrobiales bacterium]
MSNWVRVASAEGCPVGKLTAVTAGSTPIVLANVEGTLCALLDECSHEEYALSDGDLDGSEVVCVYHGARFDACTGARKALPAVQPVRSFPVEVRDGDVYVDIG